MKITATQLRSSPGKYLALAKTQDILITRNGKPIAKLTAPIPERVALLDSLVGIASDASCTEETIRQERLERQLHIL